LTVNNITISGEKKPLVKSLVGVKTLETQKITPVKNNYFCNVSI